MPTAIVYFFFLKTKLISVILPASTVIIQLKCEQRDWTKVVFNNVFGFFLDATLVAFMREGESIYLFTERYLLMNRKRTNFFSKFSVINTEFLIK